MSPLYGYVRKTKPALWVTMRKEKPVERKRRSKRSNKGNDAEYREAASAFIRNLRFLGGKCIVVEVIEELRRGRRYGWPISSKLNEVHHKFGRVGDLRMWKPGWQAVSKAGHRWIHANIAEARKYGWICQPGDWNNPEVIERYEKGQLKL